nr:hypothetical protein [Tanacetum cinerariifolium]
MNPIATQQVALDNALVAPEKRLKIVKCNARIEFNKPLNEAAYQVTLDALKLSPCYLAFLITAEVPEIYMHQFSKTIKKIKDIDAYCLSWIRKNAEFTLKSFVKFSRSARLSLTMILLNLHPMKRCCHLSKNSVTLASVICYLQSIQIKCTSHGEHLLLSSIGSSMGRPQTENYQKYRALISGEMINQDIKDSKAYKTYLGFATGEVAPKKANEFKKIASPSKKPSPVLEEEPAKKSKRAKKPANKSTTVPKAGVVIRDTPGVSMSKKKAPAKVDRGKGMDLLFDVPLLKAAQLKKVLKKSKKDTHMLHASGLSEGADLKLEVLDGSKGKSFEISEGTGLKLRVPDVDSERTDLNDDENPTLNLKDDEEEYVHTPKIMNLLTMKKSMRNYVRMFDNEVIFMMNVKVRCEEASTQTPSLLTVPLTIILKTSTVDAPTIPLIIPPITPFLQQSTPNPAPTTM